MKNRILITGASGFIGACMTENLIIEGTDVAVVTRNINKAWRLNKFKNDVRIYNLDLCDEDSVNNMILEYKPNIIFHMATYGGYYFQNDDKRILVNNIFSTFNLIKAIKKIEVDSFINIGSSSEYGRKSSSMKEDDLLNPINTYGVSKSTNTLYCKMSALNYDLPIATIRLFSPFGYYEHKSRLISSVILSCLNDENPKLSSQKSVRDFIFIEDVIELIKKISLSNNICGKVYNCGTGKQHSVKEMVDAIIKVSGKKLIPEWGKLESRKSDTNRWEADMSLVEKEICWKPKYSLEKGIKKTYEWYKDNLRLYMEDL